MEIKGKHIYGVGAAIAGAAALIFALLYWIINRQWDTTTQAGLAIGLLGLVLFAWLEIDWLTGLLKTRQVRYGAESLVFTILFLVVIGLLTYIFTREGFQKSWDVTADQQFTLRPETINVLTQMTEPVKVLAFYSPSSFGREDAETLLKNYSEASNQKVTYEFVDLNSQPGLAQEYGVTIDGQLIATRGSQREEVQFANESDLTNAIVRLDDPTVRTVYFIAGHGEASTDDTGQEGLSTTKQYLEGVNVTVKTLNVLGDSVPVDATAMVIVGPQKPYTQAEVDLLARYVNGGGKLVILLEPSVLQGVEPGQSDPLVDYLATTWGIIVRDDFVIDSSTNYDQTPINVVTSNFTETSPILEGLIGYQAAFPLARSLDISPTLPDGVVATAVIKTFPTAWGETNLGALSGEGEVAPDATEAFGELTLAVTAQNTATNGRVVVFGDSTFAQNQFWQSRYVDSVIMLNAVKWVTSKEDTISLTPRNTTDTTLNIYSTRDVTIVFLLACLLPPLVVAGLGIGVWWSRRRG